MQSRTMVTKDEQMLEREEAILDEIIQYYLAKREAISARTLSKISQLALSPTTIRNLMEDLSAEGLLTTEGVTRGRIPTQKAFTIYVAKLTGTGIAPESKALSIQPMEEGQPSRLSSLAQQLGRFLADQTGYVALVELPRKDHYPLDWVRFLAVPGDRVVVIIQTLFGDLWSKVLVSPEHFPEDLLQEVGRFINDTYRGASLERIRSDIMAGEPKEILENMPSLGAAFRMLRRAFEWPDEPEWQYWGQENLFRIREFQDPEQLLRLHRALKDPRLLERALARGRDIDHGRISIGTETAYPGLETCSVVAFPFGWQRWRGWIGVLGPMGMDYQLVIHLDAQVAKVAMDHLAQGVREQGFAA